MSALSKFWANEPQGGSTSRQMRRFMLLSLLTLFAFTILMAYLSPFAYMASTSLKDLEMISNPDAPLLPSAQATCTSGQDNPWTNPGCQSCEPFRAASTPGR